MKKWIAYILAVLLIAPMNGADSSPYQQAQKIAPGQNVSIVLTDKKTYKGELIESGPTQVEIETSDGMGRVFEIQDIAKIKVVKIKEPGSLKHWLAKHFVQPLVTIGVIVAAPVILLGCALTGCFEGL